MKCNHLALAIGGCFSKRRTAALFKGVSKVVEQSRAQHSFQGQALGKWHPPGCSLRVPASSEPAWRSCSPKLLLIRQGEEMGAAITILKPNTLPSSPSKQGGLCLCLPWSILVDESCCYRACLCFLDCIHKPMPRYPAPSLRAGGGNLFLWQTYVT